MKNTKQLEETHTDMPEEVIRALYMRLDRKELQAILNKMKRCKSPDAYHFMCTRVVEELLSKKL